MEMKPDIERIASKLFAMLQGIVPAGKADSMIMDVSDLCDMLKVKPDWVYKQIQFKAIPHFHAGKFPRFKRKEIDQWIAEQSMPSTCPPYPKLKCRA
jgi:predicted DNA-binding transcriptional regulator AlpA